MEITSTFWVLQDGEPAAWQLCCEQFNQARYFDCHELIEHRLWAPLPPGEQKRFYQAVLQAAVGLHHLQRGNPTGARNKLRQSLEKLNAYAPETTPLGPGIKHLCDALADILFQLEAHGLSAAQQRPAPQLLPYAAFFEPS
ncbi:MAG: DUF309 domain-containing protein [Candidatus Melainabacteria bacterium]|nr:DUF309 domain-containing protein [Candidatus Melainabacteria bacterium]